MSYFFKVTFKDHRGIVFSNDEYLCETTTKAELLSLALPSFYKIQNFYGTWFTKFSLYISNNEFLYETDSHNYSFAMDLNKIIYGKYFLIIYAIK